MTDAGVAARTCAVALLLAWLTLGEWQLYDRLLFSPGEDRDFVLSAVQGILDGRPAFEAWQQRPLGPAGVALLERAGLSRLDALRLWFALGLFAANATLLWIARATSLSRAVALLTGFGFARFLLTYRLEYPWDAVDVLLFMAFGLWTARSGPLAALVPLLIVGSFNHETVLYLPLWLLLTGPRRARALGALAAGACAGVMYGLHAALYVSAPPEAAAQRAEATLPLLGNHVHILHNLRQLFMANWLHGRVFVSLTFFGALAACLWLVWVRRGRVAALWSLCVLGAVASFGYVNETRLYLPLLAFWFARLAAAAPRRPADRVTHCFEPDARSVRRDTPGDGAAAPIVSKQAPHAPPGDPSWQLACRRRMRFSTRNRPAPELCVRPTAVPAR